MNRVFAGDYTCGYQDTECIFEPGVLVPAGARQPGRCYDASRLRERDLPGADCGDAERDRRSAAAPLILPSALAVDLAGLAALAGVVGLRRRR